MKLRLLKEDLSIQEEVDAVLDPEGGISTPSNPATTARFVDEVCFKNDGKSLLLIVDTAEIEPHIEPEIEAIYVTKATMKRLQLDAAIAKAKQTENQATR